MLGDMRIAISTSTRSRSVELLLNTQRTTQRRDTATHGDFEPKNTRAARPWRTRAANSQHARLGQSHAVSGERYSAARVPVWGSGDALAQQHVVPAAIPTAHTCARARVWGLYG